MKDRTLSAHHASAAALWVVSLVLILAGLASERIPLGHLGLLAAAGAAVCNIRGFICRATSCVLENERNAFELGRDSADIRALR